MVSTKKYLCWVMVALMFFAVVSSGCGGGGSGPISSNSNEQKTESEKDNATQEGETTPTPTNPETQTPTNPVEPETPTDDGNSTPTTPETPTPEAPAEPTVPKSVNGTWNIDSGYVLMSADVNGNISYGRQTYVSGSASEVKIEFLPDSEDIVGGTYTLVLTGDNVEANSDHGDVLSLRFTDSESGSTDTGLFHTGFYTHRTFTRTGENMFELNATENDPDGVTGSIFTVKYKITLEDSLLRWDETINAEYSSSNYNATVDTFREILLKQ